GIYVAGGGQQAAARALAQSGRAGQVKMVCHDMLPETVKYVKSGVVDFTIGQEAFVQGYMPVEILYEYHMFGRRPRLDTLFTRIDIRMQDNVSIKGYEVFTGLYSMERSY
ncbi:MAG: substrate-binding domain-containing protein, partial [Clostridia bacterium]